MLKAPLLAVLPHDFESAAAFTTAAGVQGLGDACMVFLLEMHGFPAGVLLLSQQLETHPEAQQVTTQR
jgi:hypothetical protein